MNIKEMQDNTNKFFGNQGQTTEIPDLTRIADALEKIARELEEQNKLKVAEMPTDSYDGIPLKRGGKIVTSNLMKLTR